MKEIHTEKYDLYNGDCLKVMDRLIQEGKKVDAIITDPPYGTIKSKNNFWDNVISFPAMWKCIELLKADYSTPVVLFGNEPFSSDLIVSNRTQFKYYWIWQKENGANFLSVNHQPFKITEQILVFGNGAVSPSSKQNYLKYYPVLREGKPYRQPAGQKRNPSSTVRKSLVKTAIDNSGWRYPVNILSFKHDTVKYHSTEKPVALMEYLVKTYTKEGDIVLDFTMGSGSTGVACMNTNRRFIGIELNEKYFDIAAERLKE